MGKSYVLTSYFLWWIVYIAILATYLFIYLFIIYLFIYLLDWIKLFIKLFNLVCCLNGFLQSCLKHVGVTHALLIINKVIDNIDFGERETKIY